jgi:hypothetical protein
LVLNSQAISEYEIAVHLKSREVRLNVHSPLAWFIYEHAGAQGFHPTGREPFRNVVKRNAGSNNRADQQNVASTRIKLAGECDFALTPMSMAGNFHEAATDRGVECADKVGEKHKRIVEYSYYGQLAGRRGRTNLLGEVTYSILDFLF